MIPRERDTTMLVTMTAGDLYTLMKEAAQEAAAAAVKELLPLLAEIGGKVNAAQDSDIVIGGEAIANAIGVNRSTMYKLRREGKLGNAVMQMGNGKLIAQRSELMNAIKENQAQ